MCWGWLGTPDPRSRGSRGAGGSIEVGENMNYEMWTTWRWR